VAAVRPALKLELDGKALSIGSSLDQAYTSSSNSQARGTSSLSEQRGGSSSRSVSFDSYDKREVPCVVGIGIGVAETSIPSGELTRIQQLRFQQHEQHPETHSHSRGLSRPPLASPPISYGNF
jgi:hypothetical protein